MLYDFKKLLINAEVTTTELTSAFWEGKRWLVFDTSKKMLAVRDLECFCHYDEAARACVSNRTINATNQIVLLGRLLKILNNAPKHNLSSANRKDFLVALEQTPASLCGPFCNYIDSIERNDYFPLNKNLVINPLTYVENYHVLSIPEPKTIAENNARGIVSRFNIHSSFEAFEKSLEAFNATVFGNNRGMTRYFLVGQFMHKVLELDDDGMPVKNTGIAFFMSTKTKSGQKLQINQLNDITSPFVLKYSVFAKYRNETKKVDCYDGALKKGLLGTVLGFMDFKHYLFE